MLGKRPKLLVIVKSSMWPSRVHLYKDHSDVGLRIKPTLESVVFFSHPSESFFAQTGSEGSGVKLRIKHVKICQGAATCCHPVTVSLVRQARVNK